MAKYAPVQAPRRGDPEPARRCILRQAVLTRAAILGLSGTARPWPGRRGSHMSRPERLSARPQAVARVVNLCRRLRYLSAGYYCLAAGRGARPQADAERCGHPRPVRKTLFAFALPELDRMPAGHPAPSCRAARRADFDLHACSAGQRRCRFRDLARRGLRHLPIPAAAVCASVTAAAVDLASVTPVGLHRLPVRWPRSSSGSLRDSSATAPWRASRSSPGRATAIAVLHNPQETLPPSEPAALESVSSRPARRWADVELDHCARLPPSGRVRRPVHPRDHGPRPSHLSLRPQGRARRHAGDRRPDARSCAAPTRSIWPSCWRRTTCRRRGRWCSTAEIVEARIAISSQLGYPVVLKIPDGSFSRGVVQVENRAQVARHARANCSQHSRLILAQEYMYTTSTGVSACSTASRCSSASTSCRRSHWQIVKHKGDGPYAAGALQDLRDRRRAARRGDPGAKAASLIGDGLYGVDLKQTDDGVYVIEINDNPNIDQRGRGQGQQERGL